ncbi:DUF2946 family protein [Halomonas sp. THAF12]|uniref:DUF2946 family protein n=1 Tax=Halomonas sp. B23F22_10 TaxID=3459515 RepID=UPI00373F5F20
MSRTAPSNPLPYRLAAGLALLAMIMLFAGPLTSQLQAADHHHPPGEHEAGHSHGAMPGMPTSGDGAAVFRWFEPCGYCALWQQFPSAHVALPAIAREALKPACSHFQPARPAATRSVADPGARPRPPPRLS